MSTKTSKYTYKRCLALLVVACSSLSTQVFADATIPYTENFESFTGSGFSPTAASGNLDSDDWRTVGLSDGDTAFGDTNTTGDYARGESTGGVSIGGIYAFDTGFGNTALGVQPTGSDFTPGEFILKIQNTTGSTINDLEFAYVSWSNNDQERSNSFISSYSTDGVSYIALNSIFTNDTSDTSGFTPVTHTAALSNVGLANNSFIYFKWESDDLSGSGPRDELALDNISLKTPVTIINNANVSDPCACNLDAGTGLANGTLSETVTVNSSTGESWSVVSVDSLLAGDPNTPTGIAVGDSLIETPAGSGVYEITFNHTDAVGYSLTVRRGNDPTTDLSISNLCAVPSIAFNAGAIQSNYVTTDSAVTLNASLVAIENGGTAAAGSPTFSLNSIDNINQLDPGSISPGNYELSANYETDGTGTGTGGTATSPAVPVNACPVGARASFVVSATPNGSAPTNIPVFGPFGLLAMLMGLLWFGNRRRNS